jgi:opacity protein-like surface antigen
LLACISLAVLIASPVMAADLLVRPTVVAAPYSWTGVYIGVNEDMGGATRKSM